MNNLQITVASIQTQLDAYPLAAAEQAVTKPFD